MGASETPLERMRLAAYRRILKQDTEDEEGKGTSDSPRDESVRSRGARQSIVSDEQIPPDKKSHTTKETPSGKERGEKGFLKVTLPHVASSKGRSMLLDDQKKTASSTGLSTKSTVPPDLLAERKRNSKEEKAAPEQHTRAEEEKGEGFQKQTAEGRASVGQKSPQKEAGISPGTASRESKFRRVAKLLLIIGKEEASKILSRLDEAQIEAITRELASIKIVTQQEAQDVLEEFRALLVHRLGSYSADEKIKGGPETAKQLLTQAFGEDVAERYLRRAAPEALEKPFQFLEEYRAEQIVPLLKEETTPTLALIFSHLSPQLAARCLKLVEPSIRVQIVRRIAKMQKIAPEVIERVSEALREKIRNVGKVESSEIDGKAALAEILRHSNPELGEELLEALEEQDPTLGQELKERLYTIEDIVRIEDRLLQEKLRSMSDRDIALLLKGKTHRVVDKIKSNLSSTRRSLVEQEGELLGAVQRREVAEIERDVLSWLRLGREKGTIPFIDEEDLIK